MSNRAVQPYGVRVGEWTLISEHRSVFEAFEAIDRLSDRMVRTGAPSDAIQLIVVDQHGATVSRPDAQ